MLSKLILSLLAVSTLNSPAQIKDYITARAMDYGVRPDIAVAIVRAESGFNPEAHNASSSASGLAQYVDGTAQYYCIDKYKLATSLTFKNDPYLQIECMVRMLSEDGGIRHWDASKSIWSKDLDLPY